MAAWLSGAKFQDSCANLLHVYGLAAKIRSTIHANAFAWTIGNAAWGGQADLIVDEFAVYLSTLTTADAQSVAQSGSVPPLEHHIWAQRNANRSGFGSINAAINEANASGGGTLLIEPGTYTRTLRSSPMCALSPTAERFRSTARCASVSVTTLGQGSNDMAVRYRTFKV